MRRGRAGVMSGALRAALFGSTWIPFLTLISGGHNLRGTGAGAGESHPCWAVASHLACRTDSAWLRMWQLMSPPGWDGKCLKSKDSVYCRSALPVHMGEEVRCNGERTGFGFKKVALSFTTQIICFLSIRRSWGANSTYKYSFIFGAFIGIFYTQRSIHAKYQGYDSLKFLAYTCCWINSSNYYCHYNYWYTWVNQQWVFWSGRYHIS